MMSLLGWGTLSLCVWGAIWSLSSFLKTHVHSPLTSILCHYSLSGKTARTAVLEKHQEIKRQWACTKERVIAEWERGILCKHSPCRRTARSLVVIPLFSLTETQDECMNECEKKQREWMRDTEQWDGYEVRGRVWFMIKTRWSYRGQLSYVGCPLSQKVFGSLCANLLRRTLLCVSSWQLYESYWRNATCIFGVQWFRGLSLSVFYREMVWVPCITVKKESHWLLGNGC